jgi:LacI family transcriptional regulator
MRGVMRYANLQRRWLIHEELRLDEAVREQIPPSDGAILAGVSGDLLQFICAQSRHVVRCSGSADPRETPTVSMDDRAIGAMAAEHLFDCRLEHFGFYGHVPSPVSHNRFEGFCDTVKARGFHCSDAGVGWPTSLEVRSHGHLPALLEWLNQLPKPVGIMCVDDSAAHDLAAACLQARLSVPDRVAIIGVNNDDLLCESAWPPISSINCDYSRVGYLAAAMLERLLRGEKFRDAERAVRLTPLGVVRRQSTDLLAIADPSVAEAVRYIREHACKPCSVDEVLRAVPVNRRWLERQFQKNLRRNPHDEIMRVRIETAKRMLLRPEMTLEEIAERCGFASNQNFGRAFRQQTGSTPGAYRRSIARGSGK